MDFKNSAILSFKKTMASCRQLARLTATDPEILTFGCMPISPGKKEEFSSFWLMNWVIL